MTRNSWASASLEIQDHVINELSSHHTISAGPNQPTTPSIRRKRLFNKAFIKTRPLALTHAQEGLDLSFALCGCSLSVKINRAWQSELSDRNSVCVLEAIPLLGLILWDEYVSLHSKIVVCQWRDSGSISSLGFLYIINAKACTARSLFAS